MAESFEKNLIDEKAVTLGKKQKREQIGSKILGDMIEWRGVLTKNINKYDHKLDEETLDEAVQRILDRLIFIKSCEDRQIENNMLLAKARQWAENWQKSRGLWAELILVFREFDQKYNSKLFEPHPCELLKIDNDVINKIINELNGDEEGLVKYDFSAIPADILGSIYEQYLGHILKKSAKTTKVIEKHAHRKEQGIYYTPTYIVDYIVKNTLVEYAKDKNLDEILEVNVLDPACGSGSFLIKAYSTLLELVENRLKNKEVSKRWQSFKVYRDRLTLPQKITIMKQCIHGVDLDAKAVEIAQLNLLLKLLEGETRETLSNLSEMKKLLPMLNSNIKCGNSLIDDPTIAGDKAFKWEDEFKEIMAKGGFDVVVGNPPWVSIKGKQKSINLTPKELNYLLQKYPCDTYRPNLFEMFVWRGLSLTREGDYFGFIVPDRICYNGQFVDIRKHILENFTLKKLWFRPEFDGVISDNVILIAKKEKTSDRTDIEIAEYPSIDFKKIPKKAYTSLSDFSWFIVDKNILSMYERIKNDSRVFGLGEKFKTSVGFIAKPNKVNDVKENNKQIRILKGENIKRFGIENNHYFEFKKENLAGGTQDIGKLSKRNKVFLRKTGINIISTFDDSGIYPEQSAYFIYLDEDDEKDRLKILCALLNSKLINIYYRNFGVTNRDTTPQLKKVDLDRFPIILSRNSFPMVKLVDRMLFLNKHLNEIGKQKTDERDKIGREILRIESDIDKMVYEIYGVSEEERKIIEDSLK